ncbi:MAG TPA: hypothetical protein PKW07_09720 [Syntrophorhabdaceae bacterium]|nr:hypothetical protein [Syntrophorhabdaceae bacterium]
MSDYDDRPNWREIDRKKDRSRHYGRSEEKDKTWQRPDANRWEMGRRKEAIERLFKGEKGTLEHDRLFNNIHKSYGKGTFISHIKAYVEKYGMPDDVSTLLLILDSDSIEYILDAINKIKDIFHKLTSRQKDDVKRKLSILKMTHKSSQVKEKAEEALRGL